MNNSPLVTRRSAFLAAYVKHRGNVTKAAGTVGISRQTHYDWLRTLPAYFEEFSAAQQELVDQLEARAMELALDGSEGMIRFLLRALRPQQYGKGGGNRVQTLEYQAQAGQPQPGMAGDLARYREVMLGPIVASSPVAAVGEEVNDAGTPDGDPPSRGVPPPP